ncbi:13890_t:CDS:2, partial [Racocetra fulgida]
MDTSAVEPERAFATFAEARITIERYTMQINSVIILRKITTKFSTVSHKLDNDDLSLIERLYDNELRTKNIFSVLNSVSSKYIHKPDVYNTVSRQCKRKLQDLSEVELLLKTLCDDDNIVGNIALNDVYNDEQDQDDEFIQAVFWAYHDSISEFAVEKDVLIINATYKTNRFSMPLIVICSVDQFGSTYPLAFTLVYSEKQDFYIWILQQLSKVLIVFTGNTQIETIITDRELALIISSKKYSSEQKIKKNNLIAFKTVSIDNTANCDKLKMPEFKCKHGWPPKTDTVKQNSNNNAVRLCLPE